MVELSFFMFFSSIGLVVVLTFVSMDRLMEGIASYVFRHGWLHRLAALASLIVGWLVGCCCRRDKAVVVVRVVGGTSVGKGEWEFL